MVEPVVLSRDAAETSGGGATDLVVPIEEPIDQDRTGLLDLKLGGRGGELDPRPVLAFRLQVANNGFLGQGILVLGQPAGRIGADHRFPFPQEADEKVMAVLVGDLGERRNQGDPGLGGSSKESRFDGFIEHRLAVGLLGQLRSGSNGAAANQRTFVLQQLDEILDRVGILKRHQRGGDRSTNARVDILKKRIDELGVLGVLGRADDLGDIPADVRRRALAKPPENHQLVVGRDLQERGEDVPPRCRVQVFQHAQEVGGGFRPL